MRDQAYTLRTLAEESPSEVHTIDGNLRTIAVTGGKGGIGKTSIAANLAVTLSNDGRRVAILDGDLGLANMDIMLGLNCKYNIGDMLFDGKSIDEIIRKGPSGVSLIPGASGLRELANLSPLALNRLVSELTKLEGMFDILLVDTGPGISNSVSKLLVRCDEIIVIVTQQPTSFADAYATIKVVLADNPLAGINIIVNEADTERHAKIILEKMRTMVSQFLKSEIGYLGFIPNDINVRKSVEKFEPYVTLFPHSPASRSVRSIAKGLLGLQNSSDGDFEGFLNGIQNLLFSRGGLSG